MTAKVLRDVLGLAERWPEEAQRELAEIAFEMDVALSGGTYHASEEELQVSKK
jgi:hypothetical protein